MVAVGGFLPVGYYKDDAKSAATFRDIEGRRWSIPGDFATVNADGTIQLLGRGSVCINTGGEKVFPEEVEEVLKTHPAVRDAVVVGVPDDRFGEVIVGVVEPAERCRPSTADDLRAHVSGRLARVQGAAPRCSSSTRSAGRPTARSTTSGSRPRPSPSSLGDERRGSRPRRIEPYAGCCDRSARSTATASSS